MLIANKNEKLTQLLFCSNRRMRFSSGNSKNGKKYGIYRNMVRESIFTLNKLKLTFKGQYKGFS